MGTIMRECICGNRVSINKRLCSECAEIYGTDPDYWPEWLRWSLSDISRSVKYEYNHQEASVDSDIYFDTYGKIKEKPKFYLRGCRTETHLYQDRDKY